MHSITFIAFILSFFQFKSDKNDFSIAKTSFSEGENVLERMYAALESAKNIQYNHQRIIDYASLEMKNELAGLVYFDFSAPAKLAGTRYYYKGDNLTIVYNGTESFVCNDVDQSIIINRSPAIEDMEHLSFLNHSIFSLRKALPWIIADRAVKKNVSDTMFNNKPCHVVRFSLKKDMIGTMGDRWYLEEDVLITYRILVDKTIMCLPALSRQITRIMIIS
jgi:hypothetical protein